MPFGATQSAAKINPYLIHQVAGMDGGQFSSVMPSLQGIAAHQPQQTSAQQVTPYSLGGPPQAFADPLGGDTVGQAFADPLGGDTVGHVTQGVINQPDADGGRLELPRSILPGRVRPGSAFRLAAPPLPRNTIHRPPTAA